MSLFDRCQRRFPRLQALALAGAATAAAVLGSGPAHAFPTPAVVAFRWELKIEPGKLRVYVDPTEGSAYWYFTYEITNDSGRDQIWAPNLTLYTDRGEILNAGEGVPPRVEGDILEYLGRPLLEKQSDIIGDVRQGREHAREGLAVWAAQTLDVNELSLFIGGLSGETARVIHPITGEAQILRKTLQRNYLIRGDVLPRRSDGAEVVEQRWVLR